MLGTTLFVPVLAAALGASPPAEKLTNRALFERTARGTVHIATLENGKARAAGSGWVIDAKRKWILTNFHLLPGGGTPQEMRKFVAEATQRWGEVIRAAKVPVN